MAGAFSNVEQSKFTNRMVMKKNIQSHKVNLLLVMVRTDEESCEQMEKENGRGKQHDYVALIYKKNIPTFQAVKPSISC